METSGENGDELEAFYCSSCELDELKKEAEDFCPECDEYFCKTCALKHSRRKLTVNHKSFKVEDLKTMPVSLLSLKTVCEEHNEIFENYCSKHESPCCDMCLPKHKDCSEIVSISQRGSSSYFLEDTENSLNNLENSIGTLVAGKSSMVAKMNKQVSEYRKQICEIRTEINEHLNKLEKDLDNEIDEAFLQPIADIETTVKSLQDNDKQIGEWKRTLSDVVKFKEKASDVQIFLIAQKLKTAIEKKELRVKTINGHNKTHEICVTFTEPIEQFLNSLVSSFGKLDHRAKIGKPASENKVQAQVCAAEKSPIPNGQLENGQLSNGQPQNGQLSNGQLQNSQLSNGVTETRRHSNGDIKRNVMIRLRKRLDLNLSKIAGDMKIFGCSSTSDGKLLLGDKRNQRIVVLNSDGSLNGLIRLKCKPNNIAYANGKVFYSSYSSKTVGKVDLETKRVEKEVMFDTACEALTLSDRNVIVHLTEKEYNILDFNLGAVGRIPIKNKNCPYLSFCKGKIYFAYWKEDTVFCFDMSGQILWKVKDQNLLSPTGVTTDSDGNLYVSGFESNNIMRISNDGNRRDLIDLKYSLRAPYSIFYNRETNRLLVTTKDTTKILEFDVI